MTEINRDAMFAYVADETPIDLIAEAWRVLADFDLDPTGRSVRSDGDWIDDDWCKMACRVLRGFAEGNSRPKGWPWERPEFDRFPWKEAGQ